MIGARRNGAIVSRNGTAIEIAPPFTIERDEALEGIARLERAIAEANHQLFPNANGGPR